MKHVINEVFEEFQENRKELNDIQKSYLLDNYNKSFRFEYAEGHLCYIFKTKLKEFNNMKYFLGFEYEKDSIETFIQINKDILVVYDTTDRISNLVNKLQMLED